MEKGFTMVFKAPRRVAAATAAALLTLTLAACASTEASTDDGSDAGSGGEEVTLSLVAYSTPQAAYEKIIAAFQETEVSRDLPACRVRALRSGRAGS